MIPASLTSIDWSDLQRLIETGRAEDDTIEFKRSFKGGDDYVALNDKAREQSLDALAREVLAFLNTRGGDLIVGVRESSAAPPVAEEITSIANVHDAADRIARGLGALIEPAQTSVAVRAIADPNDHKRGVLLIRVRSSVRAPHRSKRTRECFARRGSESVPMAMDEIQDLTINRTRLRLEQAELLDVQFADFIQSRSDHQSLSGNFLHVRAVFQPITDQTIKIDDQLANTCSTTNPRYYRPEGGSDTNDVAFRQLGTEWKPILRGQKREKYTERVTTESNDFMYAAKRIKESGITSFDFAGSSHYNESAPSVHFEWLVGFFAQITENLLAMSKLVPTLLPATLRVGVRVSGEVWLNRGSGMWVESEEMPSGTYFIPDFDIQGQDALLDAFERVQVDIFSLAGLRLDEPFSLRNPADPV